MHEKYEQEHVHVVNLVLSLFITLHILTLSVLYVYTFFSLVFIDLRKAINVEVLNLAKY